MEKINVKICLGTTCFVMGASKLQELEKALPQDLKGKVDFSAQACLGLCQQAGFAKAPFVKINDEIISAATVEKVVERLKEIVG